LRLSVVGCLAKFPGFADVQTERNAALPIEIHCRDEFEADGEHHSVEPGSALLDQHAVGLGHTCNASKAYQMRVSLAATA
jgi:hypothetical protein